MSQTYTITVYKFDELSEDIQNRLLLTHNQINIEEGNSKLEDWLAQVTDTIAKDSGLIVTLAYSYDKSNLLGTLYIPDKTNPENKKGVLYSTEIQDDQQIFYQLNDKAQIEKTVEDAALIKTLTAAFSWFTPVYETFVNNMKVWCSLAEIKNTLQKRLYLQDGRFVSVNTLAKELSRAIHSQKQADTNQ